MTTLDDVTKKKSTTVGRGAAASELVRLAKEQGLTLTGTRVGLPPFLGSRQCLVCVLRSNRRVDESDWTLSTSGRSMPPPSQATQCARGTADLARGGPRLGYIPDTRHLD